MKSGGLRDEACRGKALGFAENLLRGVSLEPFSFELALDPEWTASWPRPQNAGFETERLHVKRGGYVNIFPLKAAWDEGWKVNEPGHNVKLGWYAAMVEHVPDSGDVSLFELLFGKTTVMRTKVVGFWNQVMRHVLQRLELVLM